MHMYTCMYVYIFGNEYVIETMCSDSIGRQDSHLHRDLFETCLQFTNFITIVGLVWGDNCGDGNFLIGK